MWTVAAQCVFYVSITGVALLAILLLCQWIGRLRKDTGIFKIPVAWRNFHARLLSWQIAWPAGLKAATGIVMAVLLSRLFIFLLGTIWSLYFTDGHSLNLGAIWQKWDAYHYLFLAQNGYVTHPHDKAVLIAFYPLYPLLIKIGWFVFRDYTFAGYFVSIASLTAACFFLHKLVTLHASVDTAAKAVLFLLISPFSVFLGLLFTESLFLALTLAFFYSLAKQHWFRAGLMGFLAATAKNQGLLLVIPFLMEAIATLVDEKRKAQPPSLWRSGMKALTPALLIPTGFLVYLLVNFVVFGDPLQFLAFQKTHWHNSFGFFARNMENLWQQVPSYPGHQFRFSVMMLQPIVFLSALMLLFIAVVKKIPPSINAFSLVFLLISFSPTWLLSGARYTTTLFYIPMVLAMFSTTTTRLVLLSNLSASLMSLFVILYVEGAML